jgi:hypothetical protein
LKVDIVFVLNSSKKTLKIIQMRQETYFLGFCWFFQKIKKKGQKLDSNNAYG